MRRIHRIVLLTALIGAAPVLSGCENFDLDKLDVFNLNEKKKLPGERREVFPGGVPGVNQGIPPEYLHSNLQEQPGAAIADPAPAPAPAAGEKTAAVPPAEPAKPAPAKPKKKVAAKPKAKVAAPAPQPAAAPAPQAEQKTAPWPDQPPPANASPWPTQQNQANAPWPASPPSGTFSR